MAAKQAMPEIDAALCIRCGDCATRCPTDALAAAPNSVPSIDEELCAYCGDCEDICPVGAIRLPYQVVMRDKKESY
jgi:formate hydrogenlyase subunit 6/NADH:ubiquinone oxidoreductase subunit I